MILRLLAVSHFEEVRSPSGLQVATKDKLSAVPKSVPNNTLLQKHMVTGIRLATIVIRNFPSQLKYYIPAFYVIKCPNCSSLHKIFFLPPRSPPPLPVVSGANRVANRGDLQGWGGSSRGTT